MPTRTLHPSLLETLTAAQVDPERFSIGLPPNCDLKSPRSDIFLVGDGDEVAIWRVKSLGSLVRGNATPPSMAEYPDDYVPVFACIEQRIAWYARLGRPPTDAELDEVFSNLARGREPRRPDPTHDAVWQIVAITLGIFPLSAPEIVAVLQRLSKSASGWKMGPTSRRYLEHIQGMFGGE